MVVFMNKLDMKERDIAPGTLVEIEIACGRRAEAHGFLARPSAISQGSIGAYYPQTNPLLR
jgi:anaerobic selenocysteine-containing dehydrogenase